MSCWVPHETTKGHYDRYAYVLNQPLELTDPTGYESWGEIWGYNIQWSFSASGGSASRLAFFGVSANLAWGGAPAGNGQTIVPPLMNTQGGMIGPTSLPAYDGFLNAGASSTKADAINAAKGTGVEAPKHWWSPGGAGDVAVVAVMKWLGDRPGLVNGINAAAAAADMSAGNIAATLELQAAVKAEQAAMMAAAAVKAEQAAMTAAAKGVSNPEIAKGTFPLVAPLTQRGVGEVIGWGKKGAPDTLARIESLSASEVATMQRRGISPDVARKIRDFYANEMVRNSNNPTAAARVQLMDKIMEMMK